MNTHNKGQQMTEPVEAGPGTKQPLLTDIEWVDRYATGRDDLVKSFYDPALQATQIYDRATGYFRSSFYSLTRDTVAAFALRGGRIRLICSPELDEADVEALQRGESARQASDDALRQELARILAHPHAASGAEILAALYAHESLEIRLAVPVGSGIFHDKFGVFTDARGARVSFSGSVNETWHAWHPYGNHESFEVFTSWGREAQRPAAHALHFEQIWSNRTEGLEVVAPSDEALAELRKRAQRNPVEILEQATERTRSNRPRLLMDHQRQALRAWHNAGRCGILKHATGSGKTITALEAIREHLWAGGAALVLVPSILLVEQWDEEINRNLSDLDIAVLHAGGGHTEWRSRLRAFTSSRGNPRLTIATIATASSDDFLQRIEGGGHLLVVADEVHRMGAPQAAHALRINTGPRLGLSATPERAGDPMGTDRIMSYFGGVVPPEFTLADAVAAGRLCRYDYHIHPVSLTSEEQDQWEVLSAEIQKLAARAEGDDPPNLSSMDPYLKHLLIKRARIAKGAAQKASCIARVLEREYKIGDRWLIYCDNTDQLTDVRRELADRGISSMPYHASMKSDRDATLKRFERDGGIVVAIKCLDEGIDIPAVSHALIAASSRNPREFIQRRGRVLRVHEGKTRAVVHDLVVNPPTVSEGDPFRSLILGELARAEEFADHAENESAAIAIRKIAITHGVDPETLRDGGYEEEEEADDAD